MDFNSVPLALLTTVLVACSGILPADQLAESNFTGVTASSSGLETPAPLSPADGERWLKVSDANWPTGACVTLQQQKRVSDAWNAPDVMPLASPGPRHVGAPLSALTYGDLHLFLTGGTFVVSKRHPPSPCLT